MFKSVLTRYVSITKYMLPNVNVTCRSEFSIKKSNRSLNSLCSPPIFEFGIFNFSTHNHCKQEDKHVLEVIPIKTVPLDVLTQTIKKRAQRRKKFLEDGGTKPGVSSRACI